MPTTLLRTQVTHTPSVAHALEAARERWPGESDSKLLLHLVELGEHVLRADQRKQADDRLAELDRISARYAHAFTESPSGARDSRPE
ncbi:MULTISPECIES: hypothetical protein [unclassified Leifsonia]|uniref:hypothetical protein n=1 Tax=unclassified Leifsonia TaxID=2663824 RepID=UPI00035D466B|nr:MULTISPECIES: hypothetical protein [unclassified Leifsonia]